MADGSRATSLRDKLDALHEFRTRVFIVMQCHNTAQTPRANRKVHSVYLSRSAADLIVANTPGTYVVPLTAGKMLSAKCLLTHQGVNLGDQDDG